MPTNWSKKTPSNRFILVFRDREIQLKKVCTDVEIEKIRNRRDESGVKVMDSMENVKPITGDIVELAKMLAFYICKGESYAPSSMEGRVAMDFFGLSEAGQSKKYIFKCHRKSEGERDIVYPINTIAFHPTTSIFYSDDARAKNSPAEPKEENRIPPAIVPAGTSEEKPVNQ
ncbi:mitotic checkpoint protein BUB3.1 [Tanacetum coccineum]